MKKILSYKYEILIAFFAALLFIPFLGQVHLFDWDEINFAESAREMMVTGDYLTVRINYEAFWEKPPFFVWLQVLSMKIFGVNEFAARFPNAICGIATLLVLFNLGKRLKNVSFGLIWTLVFAGSILPFFYFKSGIIDPWFNLFIFLGIYFLICYTKSGQKGMNAKNMALAAFFIGMGVLTKGPVALLVFLLCTGIYLIIKRFRVAFKWTHIGVFAIIFTLTGGFWFVLQAISGNFQILIDFIVYQIRLFKTQDAGHGGFFLYHFVVIFFGVFPASVFMIGGFKRRGDYDPQMNHFRIWMVILFWVVLILFTIVRTKIVHYSSLTYFPVSFIAAFYIQKIWANPNHYKRWISVLILIAGVVPALLVSLLPFIGRHKHYIIDKNWIKDAFAVGNLQAEVNWTGFESLIGIFLILCIITYLLMIKRKKYQQAIVLLFSGTLIFTFFTMVIITPKIEKFSQRAAIEFYKSLQGKDVYIHPLGYKSYAHYFYGRVTPPTNDNLYNQEWLLHGDIDKPVYFVTKVHKKDKILNENPNLSVMYEKNGFVFIKRSLKN